jgi:hypothetical protein
MAGTLTLVPSMLETWSEETTPSRRWGTRASLCIVRKSGEEAPCSIARRQPREGNAPSNDLPSQRSFPGQ